MGDFAEVSVIIPCFRCADTIARAVSSVASQSIRPAEVILVDDCSGDSTLQELFRVAEEYHDGWINVVPLPENKGPGSARNAGWARANQPYVAFLDADDGWHPRKLEVQWGWMRENPKVALTGHKWELREVDPRFPAGAALPEEVQFAPISPTALLLSNRFSTPTVMLRRDLPHRFKEGKREAEDYLLWCEILLDGNECWYSDSPMAFLFKEGYGERGLSGNLWKMEKGELESYRLLKISKRINYFELSFLQLWSLLKFLRRILVVVSRRLGRK